MSYTSSFYFVVKEYEDLSLAYLNRKSLPQKDFNQIIKTNKFVLADIYHPEKLFPKSGNEEKHF